MALCYDGTNVHLHGYVDFDFADDVNSCEVPLVMSSLWELDL